MRALSLFLAFLIAFPLFPSYAQGTSTPVDPNSSPILIVDPAPTDTGVQTLTVVAPPPDNVTTGVPATGTVLSHADSKFAGNEIAGKSLGDVDLYAGKYTNNISIEVPAFHGIRPGAVRLDPIFYGLNFSKA